MEDKSLFGEFPKISAKAWKQKIQYDLKGADYNTTLLWESAEGIKIKPFYTQEDVGVPSRIIHNGRDWGIGQQVYVGNEAAANRIALNALQSGAENIWFTVPASAKTAEVLLANIDLAKTKVYFSFKSLSQDFLTSILHTAGDNVANIYLNVDVIGNLARTGNWYRNVAEDHKIMEELLASKAVNALAVDASLYANSGANMVQQLAYAMGQANEYLNHLEQITYKGQQGAITFILSIGGNYFMEMAKLRALRILFSSLTAAYNIEIQCHILAIPSKRNKTLYDYNVNLLRSTTECMSAILGGADTVVNLPYDFIYHKRNDFAERIALNQLLLLKDEAYFNKVGNPAEGSYYLESLTRQLSEKSWELFKGMEKAGGFLRQLQSGNIQKKIKENAQKQRQSFSDKQEILVGTNKYSNPNDHMKNEVTLYPFVKKSFAKTAIEPILEKRLAEDIEKKRFGHE